MQTNRDRGADLARRQRAAPMKFSRPLLALILAQISLHSCMTGVRVAAPLMLLRAGYDTWLVGLLLGLFAAAPVATSLRVGRMADRHGYHLPMRLAVALTTTGALLAAAAAWLNTAEPGSGWGTVAMLCIAAMLCGVGANMGLITIQRSAGKLAAGAAIDLTRIFSWLGLAPAVSNMIGPVVAGVLIDSSGFSRAFLALAALPLGCLVCMRFVPIEAQAPSRAASAQSSAWSLLHTPGLRRLLVVNWLLSSSWDLHAFLVPVLGHERGLSASAIGFILGTFAAAVALVRLFIPWVAHRLRDTRAQSQVLIGAMLTTAVVFVIYPLATHALSMAACGALLGVALGSVQPMIMSNLHRLTPAQRHGEALALRSMTINAASTVMPLLFGALGTAIGAAPLFWLMAALMGAGSSVAAKVGREGLPNAAAADDAVAADVEH
jgi:MFS family permease